MPIVWYSGMTPSVRSPGSSRAGAPARAPPARSARCERGTPFGPAGRARRVEHQRRLRARRGRARRGAAAVGQRVALARSRAARSRRGSSRAPRRERRHERGTATAPAHCAAQYRSAVSTRLSRTSATPLARLDRETARDALRRAAQLARSEMPGNASAPGCARSAASRERARFIAAPASSIASTIGV